MRSPYVSCYGLRIRASCLPCVRASRTYAAYGRPVVRCYAGPVRVSRGSHWPRQMPQMALFLKLQRWPGVKRGVGSVNITMPLPVPARLRDKRKLRHGSARGGKLLRG